MIQLSFLQALILIAAAERVGRAPLPGTAVPLHDGEDLRVGLRVVAEAGLAASDPAGEAASWVSRARAELERLRVASDPHEVGAAWGQIRALLRERAGS